nr:homeodomain-like protein [Tanacetum cinerariifolium]
MHAHCIQIGFIPPHNNICVPLSSNSNSIKKTFNPNNNGLGVPTRQILDSRGAIPSKTVANAKVAIQEMAEYFQKWHDGTSRTRSTETFDGLAAILAQLNNLGREIKKENEKVYAAQVGCLGELAHTKLTVELAVRIVNYPKGIAENALVCIETRLMGETLVLNRSLDPLSGDYIKLNHLNEPLERRRAQVDDLMPIVKEGEVVEEFRAMNDARMVRNFFGYPSVYNHDKKIHTYCAYNLKFSCMIGFEFLHANFFPILYVNVMSKKFYNSIRKEKLEYKGNNVVRALMNIPIFVGTFSILTDFAVLEDMDTYRDEVMGDVIFGELFLREVGINTKWFEGMITIYNYNEEVTYQMVQSHPRFKHHTNEQFNKISPLLKVSEEDKMNGISHPYQKLKSFYKWVLNLGPEYVRDAKMEEWLTCVYEMV